MYSLTPSSWPQTHSHQSIWQLFLFAKCTPGTRHVGCASCWHKLGIQLTFALVIRCALVIRTTTCFSMPLVILIYICIFVSTCWPVTVLTSWNVNWRCIWFSILVVPNMFSLCIMRVLSLSRKCYNLKAKQIKSELSSVIACFTIDDLVLLLQHFEDMWHAHVT